MMNNVCVYTVRVRKLYTHFFWYLYILYGENPYSKLKYNITRRNTERPETDKRHFATPKAPNRHTRPHLLNLFSPKPTAW